MPIRPEYLHFYRTPEWKAAKLATLERAGYRCEQCHIPKFLRWAYRWQGWWLDPDRLQWHDQDGLPQDPPPFSGRRMVRVKIGVAHLDHDPQNNDLATNVKALCDFCHLAWDRRHHAANAHLSRANKKDSQRPLLAHSVLR